ncbi:MAG: UDP-2,3-diacylglucosamine diphosphatase [Bacteroidales bacterium]|nr:UDP-2,3-diacylglucosamine diphosphatase [Bacteroidales bacterium]
MIYFASDMHLGLPDFERNIPREKKIISWLDNIKKDATEIYFLGDIFEFWYEWKYVIPKHFSRFFGKLSELSDMGIKLHYFTGNHDIWAFGYFEKEFGMKIYREPLEIEINTKKFYLAHGDGLGPGDKWYKFMKKGFNNKILQWIFSNLVHPNLAFRLALKISQDRDACNKTPIFKGEKEWLIQHALEISKSQKFNYFIFGHRHIAKDYKLNNESKVVILGDWIKNFTYAIFDGENLLLKKHET